MRYPKYSIVVPTLNGHQYLRHSIPKILESSFDSFELIISDNWSEDETYDWLCGINDRRLRIVRPITRLNMRDHYDFALSNSQGEWVLLLGADDGVLTTVFSKMDYLTKKFPSIRVINWKRSYFFWPGVEKHYGTQRISYTSDSSHRVVKCKAVFPFSLGGFVQVFDLPQIYTCTFVHREILAKLRTKFGGKVYPNTIPDVFSSVAILQNTNEYLRINDPLTLVGSSKESLGLDDRIYLDNEVNKTVKESLLSKSTFEALHRKSISSYFLLDATMTYFENLSDVDSSKLTRYKILGLIGTGSQLLRRKGFIASRMAFVTAMQISSLSIFETMLVIFAIIPWTVLLIVSDYLNRVKNKLRTIKYRVTKIVIENNAFEIRNIADAISVIENRTRPLG